MRWIRSGSLFALICVLSMVFPAPEARAQIGPSILVDGSAGPISGTVGQTVVITGSSFFPENLVQIRLHLGADCSGGTANILSTTSTGAGTFEYMLELVQLVHSINAYDLELGMSNCVNINLPIPAPTLTYNGSEAPVFLPPDSNTVITFLGSGLTPNGAIQFHTYYSTETCGQGSPSIIDSQADLNGEVAPGFTFGAAGTFNYQVFDVTTSLLSNCLEFTIVAPPAILANGSGGPLTVDAFNLVLITGTGFTAVTGAHNQGEVFTGSGCTGIPTSTFVADSDAAGNISHEIQATLALAPQFSVRVSDAVSGPSNCVDVQVIPPPVAPSILVNGSTGSVTVDLFDFATISGTGFTPIDGTISEGRIFTGFGCTGIPLSYFPAYSDASGAIQEQIQLSMQFTSTFSVLIADTLFGASNCVEVTVISAPASVIQVNGSSGPIDVVEGATLEITGANFPPSADVAIQFLLFDGGTCPQNGLVLDTFAAGSDDQGQVSLQVQLPAYGLSNVYVYAMSALGGGTSCVQLNTSAPTSTPTEIPPTATSMATEVPTETATVAPPTDVPTTEEPTQVPTGGATITITTSTGDDIPDDTVVCIGEVCIKLDTVAGSSALNAFVNAAAPSGTTVTFSDLEVGTFPLTISTAGELVLSSEITIEPGVTTAIDLTYQLEPQGTPVVPTSTSAPVQPAQPTQPPVVSLPSTGSGNSATSGMMMLLVCGLLVVASSVAVVRRRLT